MNKQVETLKQQVVQQEQKLKQFKEAKEFFESKGHRVVIPHGSRLILSGLVVT